MRDVLQAHYPGTKGFSAQNIWRMKQFYETYCDNEKLSPLVREIPWTSNLLIMTGCKTDEARELTELALESGESDEGEEG